VTFIWSFANENYHYFANPANGFIAGEPVKIAQASEIPQTIAEQNIQTGDLMYFSTDGGAGAHHSTIITEVTADAIYYAEHSMPHNHKSLKNGLLGDESVVIIRAKD
jgi:predicted RNase H-like nuclease (RuvC/YqgF family)